VEVARRLLRVLYRVMGAVATLFYAALALVLLADVAGREILGEGIFGAQRVAVFFTIVAGNFGLALATAAGAHIRPRVADHWIPGRYGPAMDRVADVITALVLLCVAYFATQLVRESYDFETVSPTIDWQIWPVQAVIPFGYAVAALHYLIFAIYPALRPRQQQVSE